MLTSGATSLGISLNLAQVDQFRRYYEEIVNWNARVNLTSVRGWEPVVTRHFLDSLSIAAAFPQHLPDRCRIVDVGSGAGFPGIPLKIAFPELHATLIDSTSKKTVFLVELRDALGLPDVEIRRGRAEALAHEPELRESFDIVLARAVANMAVLAELTLPFCRIGGTVVAQKQLTAGTEIGQAERAITTLGGRLNEIKKVALLNESVVRSLVVIEKVGPTPQRFPRRPGMPSKRPCELPPTCRKMSYPGNNRPQSVSIKRRFFSLPTLLSFGVAAVLLVLLATRFSLDWAATWNNVRSMNLGFYVLAVLLYYLSFAFRGLRWQILARNAGINSLPDARLPSALHCSQLILAGWFVNSITWLRLGDAYRAYAFADDSRGSFPWSLGTVLAERVLDMSIVLALIILSVLLLTTTSDSTASEYVLVAAIAMAFAMLTLLFLMRRYGVRLARVLPDRLEAAYYHFHRGTLGSFKHLHILVALGIIAWFPRDGPSLLRHQGSGPRHWVAAGPSCCVSPCDPEHRSHSRRGGCRGARRDEPSIAKPG